MNIYIFFFFVRSGQTILDLALSSKKLISDMIPTERTLLVIGNKNCVSV